MKIEYTTQHLHKPTAKAICKHLGVTPDNLVERSRTPDKVFARYMYSLVRTRFYKIRNKQIGIELCRDRTSITNALKKEIMEINIEEVYQKIIVSLNRKIDDFPLKQPSEDIVELAEQLQGATQPRTVSYTFNKDSQYYSTHNFKFNADEEEAIERACQEAKEFMKSYGKGDLRIPMVDSTHYANSLDLWL